ncbi:MAG: hypothetical protein JW969_16810 [Spirochaetales bacterium]|nr:hypothetical protein [Spirochaetales bacterium]
MANLKRNTLYFALVLGLLFACRTIDEKKTTEQNKTSKSNEQPALTKGNTMESPVRLKDKPFWSFKNLYSYIIGYNVNGSPISYSSCIKPHENICILPLHRLYGVHSLSLHGGGKKEITLLAIDEDADLALISTVNPHTLKKPVTFPEAIMIEPEENLYIPGWSGTPFIAVTSMKGNAWPFKVINEMYALWYSDRGGLAGMPIVNEKGSYTGMLHYMVTNGQGKFSFVPGKIIDKLCKMTWNTKPGNPYSGLMPAVDSLFSMAASSQLYDGKDSFSRTDLLKQAVDQDEKFFPGWIELSRYSLDENPEISVMAAKKAAQLAPSRMHLPYLELFEIGIRLLHEFGSTSNSYPPLELKRRLFNYLFVNPPYKKARLYKEYGDFAFRKEQYGDAVRCYIRDFDPDEANTNYWTQYMTAALNSKNYYLYTQLYGQYKDRRNQKNPYQQASTGPNIKPEFLPILFIRPDRRVAVTFRSFPPNAIVIGHNTQFYPNLFDSDSNTSLKYEEEVRCIGILSYMDKTGAYILTQRGSKEYGYIEISQLMFIIKKTSKRQYGIIKKIDPNYRYWEYETDQNRFAYIVDEFCVRQGEKTKTLQLVTTALNANNEGEERRWLVTDVSFKDKNRDGITEIVLQCQTEYIIQNALSKRGCIILPIVVQTRVLAQCDIWINPTTFEPIFVHIEKYNASHDNNNWEIVRSRFLDTDLNKSIDTIIQTHTLIENELFPCERKSAEWKWSDKHGKFILN